MTRSVFSTAIAAAILALSRAAFAAPAPGPASSGGGDNPGSVGVVAPVPHTGEEVYRYVCQSCHMANGDGGQGAGRIPGLASNPRLAASAYPIMMVLNGRGAMPWFSDSLTPQQIADVVGYIRTHLGNAYAGPVNAADVARLAPPTR